MGCKCKFCVNSKNQVSSEAKRIINSLIERDWCRMFIVDGGKLTLLVDHYKYLDPRNEAGKIKVCKISIGDGIYYLNHTI